MIPEGRVADAYTNFICLNESSNSYGYHADSQSSSSNKDKCLQNNETPVGSEATDRLDSSYLHSKHCLPELDGYPMI
ncbi:unnamed protein product [Heterobilharzia americana]|nr:unnamed protein product [Heterobilharzia americana]